jgi:hypothetical protein
VAAALWATLPTEVLPGHAAEVRWAAAAAVVVLSVPLTLTASARHRSESLILRRASMVVPGVLSVVNAIALGYLVDTLLSGGALSGGTLIRTAFAIWGTNVIVFGLWYWELDRGGPVERVSHPQRAPDFLFSQMTVDGFGSWRPLFLDYLFVAFTAGTAFSPTDTLPLTRAAKVMMMLEAGSCLLVVVLVAARGVNILPTSSTSSGH